MYVYSMSPSICLRFTLAQFPVSIFWAMASYTKGLSREWIRHFALKWILRPDSTNSPFLSCYCFIKINAVKQQIIIIIWL